MLSPMYNEEQRYYDEYETFCYQNCLRQVLEYYKVKCAYLYINASLSIVYKEIDQDDFDISIDEEAYGVLPSFGSKVIRKSDDRDNRVIWDENTSYIEKDYPIIVTVDSYYLKHLPFYEKSHGRHCMVVVGEVEDNAIVVDWQAPWFYKGKVDLEELFAARNSQNEADGGVFSGNAIKNNWAYIEKEGWEAEPSQLVKEIIEVTKHQYTKFIENDTFYCIDAYKKIKEYFGRLIEYDVTERKKRIKNMYNALYWPVRKRNFFNFYIKRAIDDKVLSSDNIGVYDYSVQLFDDWTLFLNFVLKHSFIGKDSSIEKIVAELDKLIDKEETFKMMLFQMSI